MIKQGIRDVVNMPLSIKTAYSKILSFMTLTDRNYNQLKTAAFYRIMSKVQVASSERVQLMNFIMTKEEGLDTILKKLDLNELNDQEKNIFRFSLIKDLIIIMNADYIETDDEKMLLKSIQNHFDISEDQLSFFKEEYELDCCFFDESISPNKLKEITKKTISTAIALGIPLTTIYYSGSFKGLGFLGVVSGIRTLGLKKRIGKHSFAVGICTSIALGVITYKTLEYILHVRKDEKTKLAHLMKENMEALHIETIDNLYEDIKYFTNRMSEIEGKNEEYTDNILKLSNLLKGALGILKSTGAIIV